MTDADDLTLRARRTAAELNYLLAMLQTHDIDCLAVEDPTWRHEGFSGGRRVSLVLNFKAKKTAP